MSNIYNEDINQTFDQDLNTFDSVNFVRVNVSDSSIIDSNQLTTKSYVDSQIGSGSTFQDVYNNSSNPAEVVLVDNKPIIFKDTLDNVALYISSDGVTTQAGGVIGGFYTSKMNTIQRAYTGDTKIEVIEDIPLTTVRTTFTEDQEFVSKLYVDSQVDPTFQEVYNSSSTPAIIKMTDSKIINYTRNDNPILTLDSLNYKLTSQDVSVAKITSNNYFPPNSNNANTWSLSPYNFVASASSVINGAHEAGTSFTYVAVGSTDGWICDNDKYDLIDGLPTGTASSTIVDLNPVIGEWLQLYTSIPIAINGFYYGGLGDTSENKTAVDFKLVASNDGVNFTVVSSKSLENIIYPGKQYTFPSTYFTYSYYRIIIERIGFPNPFGRCAIGSGTAFDIIPTNPAEVRLLDDAVQITGSYLTATNFIKQGGTNQQYLMADGSSLQYSANSGNSNYYLYNSISGVMTPPPANGQIGYNNAVQNDATIIYISHRTRDTIDIDVFLALLTTIEEVYLQDQENSLNFIRYNITANPTIIPNNYISIPVISSEAGGTGLTNFGNGHNILVSFFTNSIEVDARLTSLEFITQYISIIGSPNGTAITSPLFAVKNLSSYLAGVPLQIGSSASSVDIIAPNLITNTILATTDNTYDLGFSGNSFRRGYFSTALRCPVYDTATTTLLEIAPNNANAVNIGKFSTTTTILGTTNINSVYILPNTSPSVGQVITCGSSGVANWITPSVGAFSFVYPYPNANRTVITGAGTRTLCNTYTMTSNITFSSASLFFPTTGSDNTRVGIYRGDLTTGVLVGQTASGAPSSGYFTRTITAVVGQSLTFTVGQQVVIAFTQNGSTTTIATTTGISNLALAFSSSTGYAVPGLPALISGIALPVATTIRKNIDLY